MNLTTLIKELEEKAKAATHWHAKFVKQSKSAIFVTVDADDFRELLKLSSPENILALCDRILALEDEVRTLKRDLEQKAGEIGRAEHRGNTVDYIYDKCDNYGRQLGELAQAAKELAEFYADRSNWSRARTSQGMVSGHVYNYYEMDNGMDKARAFLNKHFGEGKE